jgi:hypothetical protein
MFSYYIWHLHYALLNSYCLSFNNVFLVDHLKTRFFEGGYYWFPLDFVSPVIADRRMITGRNVAGR